MLHIACGICELQKKTTSRVHFENRNSKKQGDCQCQSDDDVYPSCSEEKKLGSNGELINIRRRKGQVLDESQDLFTDKGDGFADDSESGLKEASDSTSSTRYRESSTGTPAAMEETSLSAEGENAAASARVVGCLCKDAESGGRPSPLSREPAGSCSSSDSESPMEVKDKPQFNITLNSEEGRDGDSNRSQLLPKHHHDPHHNDSGISEHGTSDSNSSEDENGGPEVKPWEGVGCENQDGGGFNNKTATSQRQTRRARESKGEPAKKAEWRPEDLEDDLSFSTPDMGEDFYCTSSLSPFSNPISTTFCISSYNPVTNDTYSSCRLLEPEEGVNSRSSSRKTSLEERTRKVAEIVEPCGQRHITYQEWYSLSKSSDKSVAEGDFQEGRTANQSSTKKTYSSIDFEFNFEKFLREFGGQPEGTLETIYEDDLGCDEDSELSEEIEDNNDNKFCFDRPEYRFPTTNREVDVMDKSPGERQTATTCSLKDDGALTEVLVEVKRPVAEHAQSLSDTGERESLARQEESGNACMPPWQQQTQQQRENGKADPTTGSEVPSSSSSSSSSWPESTRASPPQSNGMLLPTDHLQSFNSSTVGLHETIFESLDNKEARFLETSKNPQDSHHRILVGFESFYMPPLSTSFSSFKPDRLSSSYAHIPGPHRGVSKQGVEENAGEIRNDGSAKREQTESRDHEEGVGSRPVVDSEEEVEVEKGSEEVEGEEEPLLPMRNRRREKDIRGAARLNTSVSFENTAAPGGLGNKRVMFNQQETEPVVGSGVPAAPPAAGPVRPPAASAATPTASKLVTNRRSSAAPGEDEGRADVPLSFNEHQTKFNESSVDVVINMNSTASGAVHGLNPKDNDVTSAKPAGLVVAAHSASSALPCPSVPQSQQPPADQAATAADGGCISEHSLLPDHSLIPGPYSHQATHQGSFPPSPPPTRPARSKPLASRRAHRPQNRSSEAVATSPVSAMDLAANTPSAAAESWEAEQDPRCASAVLLDFSEDLCDGARVNGDAKTSISENGSSHAEKKVSDNDLKSQDNLLELQDDSGTLCGFVVKPCISEEDPCKSVVESYDSLRNPCNDATEQSFNRYKDCCDASEPCSCAVVIHAGDYGKQPLENLETPSSDGEKGAPWDSPPVGGVLFFPFSSESPFPGIDRPFPTVEPPFPSVAKPPPSSSCVKARLPGAESDRAESLSNSGEPGSPDVEPKPPDAEPQPLGKEPSETEREAVSNEHQSSITEAQPSITDHEVTNAEPWSRITEPKLLNTEPGLYDHQPPTYESFNTDCETRDSAPELPFPEPQLSLTESQPPSSDLKPPAAAELQPTTSECQTVICDPKSPCDVKATFPPSPHVAMNREGLALEVTGDECAISSAVAEGAREAGTHGTRADCPAPSSTATPEGLLLPITFPTLSPNATPEDFPLLPPTATVMWESETQGEPDEAKVHSVGSRGPREEAAEEVSKVAAAQCDGEAPARPPSEAIPHPRATYVFQGQEQNDRGRSESTTDGDELSSSSLDMKGDLGAIGSDTGYGAASGVEGTSGDCYKKRGGSLDLKEGAVVEGLIPGRRDKSSRDDSATSSGSASTSTAAWDESESVVAAAPCPTPAGRPHCGCGGGEPCPQCAAGECRSIEAAFGNVSSTGQELQSRETGLTHSERDEGGGGGGGGREGAGGGGGMKYEGKEATKDVLDMKETGNVDCKVSLQEEPLKTKELPLEGNSTEEFDFPRPGETNFDPLIDKKVNGLTSRETAYITGGVPTSGLAMFVPAADQIKRDVGMGAGVGSGETGSSANAKASTPGKKCPVGDDGPKPPTCPVRKKRKNSLRAAKRSPTGHAAVPSGVFDPPEGSSLSYGVPPRKEPPLSSSTSLTLENLVTSSFSSSLILSPADPTSPSTGLLTGDSASPFDDVPISEGPLTSLSPPSSSIVEAPTPPPSKDFSSLPDYPIFGDSTSPSNDFSICKGLVTSSSSGTISRSSTSSNKTLIHEDTSSPSNISTTEGRLSPPPTPIHEGYLTSSSSFASITSFPEITASPAAVRARGDPKSPSSIPFPEYPKSPSDVPITGDQVPTSIAPTLGKPTSPSTIQNPAGESPFVPQVPDNESKREGVTPQECDSTCKDTENEEVKDKPDSLKNGRINGSKDPEIEKLSQKIKELSEGVRIAQEKIRGNRPKENGFGHFGDNEDKYNISKIMAPREYPLCLKPKVPARTKRRTSLPGGGVGLRNVGEAIIRNEKDPQYWKRTEFDSSLRAESKKSMSASLNQVNENKNSKSLVPQDGNTRSATSLTFAKPEVSAMLKYENSVPLQPDKISVVLLEESAESKNKTFDRGDMNTPHTKRKYRISASDTGSISEEKIKPKRTNITKSSSFSLPRTLIKKIRSQETKSIPPCVPNPFRKKQQKYEARQEEEAAAAEAEVNIPPRFQFQRQHSSESFATIFANVPPDLDKEAQEDYSSGNVPVLAESSLIAAGSEATGSPVSLEAAIEVRETTSKVSVPPLNRENELPFSEVSAGLKEPRAHENQSKSYSSLPADPVSPKVPPRLKKKKSMSRTRDEDVKNEATSRPAVDMPMPKEPSPPPPPPSSSPPSSPPPSPPASPWSPQTNEISSRTSTLDSRTSSCENKTWELFAPPGVEKIKYRITPYPPKRRRGSKADGEDILLPSETEKVKEEVNDNSENVSEKEETAAVGEVFERRSSVDDEGLKKVENFGNDPKLKYVGHLANELNFQKVRHHVNNQKLENRGLLERLKVEIEAEDSDGCQSEVVDVLTPEEKQYAIDHKESFRLVLQTWAERQGMFQPSSSTRSLKTRYSWKNLFPHEPWGAEEGGDAPRSPAPSSSGSSQPLYDLYEGESLAAQAFEFWKATHSDTPSPGPPVEDHSCDKDDLSPRGGGSSEEERIQKDRCVEVYPETVRQRQRNNNMSSNNKVDIKNWTSSSNKGDTNSPSKVKKFLPSVKALRNQFETGKTTPVGNGTVHTPTSTPAPTLSRKSSSSTSSLASSTLEKTSSTNSLASTENGSTENLLSSDIRDFVENGRTVIMDPDEPVEPIFNQFKSVDEELKELMSKPPSTTGWNPLPLLKRLYYVPEAPKMKSEGTTYINIEGYLEKLPSGRKKATFWNAWKRRYFIAKDGILYYYQNNQTEKPSMKLPLMGGKVECMEPNMVGVDDGKGHYVVVRCSSRQEAERWRRALETHTVEDFSSQYVQPWPIPTNPALLRDTLVVDLGSCSVRAGVLASNPTLPQVFFPCVVATQRDTRRQTWGLDALDPDVRTSASISFPVRPSHKITKYSVDLSAVSSLLQKTFADLKVDPKNYNLQLSVPRILNPNTQVELLKLLFDKFGCRSVNMTHQSILALYAYNATSGIVVDLGERMDIVPVIDGYIVDGGVSRVPYGGYRILDHLRQFLYMRNVSLVTEVEGYILRYVLEKLCYCAQHYNTEKARCTNNPDNFEKSVSLAEFFQGRECPYETISLDFGRFQSTEGIFNPDAWGLDHPGLHKLVHKAIQECSMDIRKEMSRSIFLVGGASQLPGLADRLSTELDNLTPPAIRPKVHCSPHRYHAAYLGACVLADSAAFQQSRITREEWNKYGNASIRKWSL